MSEDMKTKLLPPVGERDHIRGAPKAPVTLLQYGDYECPVGRQAYQIIEKLRKSAEDSVRYAYRHFPLNKVHQHAEHAAVAAEVAGDQGKYWEMHNLLFQNQNHLKDEDLIRYAKALQLDSEHLAEALGEPPLARVREDQRFGLKSGVGSTSNLFINETRYAGEMELEQIVQAIKELTDVAIEGEISIPSLRAAESSSAGNQKARRTTIAEICAQQTEVNSELLKSVLTLAVEIAREGREGRKIGTLFTIGDADAVMDN